MTKCGRVPCWKLASIDVFRHRFVKTIYVCTQPDKYCVWVTFQKMGLTSLFWDIAVTGIPTNKPSRIICDHYARLLLLLLLFALCETKSIWYWGHCLAYCTSPRWQMMMIVEQSVECELVGETVVLGENLPQCHSVHHKSHMTWTGLEPGPPLWESGY
jgi:hypothetical protein